MKKNTLQSKYLYLNSKKWSIIIFLVFALLSGNLFCQQKSKKKFKTTTSTKSIKKIKKTSNYDIYPFDLNRKQLPLDYKGVNPVLLFNQIYYRSNLHKSDYETTSQYNERISLERGKPLFGKIYTDSILAFVPKQNIDCNYNADNQTLNSQMTISYYTNTYKQESYDFNRKCILLERINKESTYSGSNAFGFNVIVDKTESNEYDLLLENWKNLNIETSIQFTTKIDVFNAKQIIESKLLGYLFIGKISEPYTCEEGYSYKKPTIDFPEEDITNIEYINLHVIEIWLFNKKTGEIYSKIKPTNDNSRNDYRLFRPIISSSQWYLKAPAGPCYKK